MAHPHHFLFFLLRLRLPFSLSLPPLLHRFYCCSLHDGSLTFWPFLVLMMPSVGDNSVTNVTRAFFERRNTQPFYFHVQLFILFPFLAFSSFLLSFLSASLLKKEAPVLRSWLFLSSSMKCRVAVQEMG